MAGCGNCEMDRIGNSNAMKYIRIKNRRLDSRKENRRMWHQPLGNSLRSGGLLK
ncbi:hypothetical protein SOASR030_32450 [Leminorella grimontii]|uniref:Uncharacterized protein n=1 Tax=Leminorella grimontii TaxID=82981 RepID=A0AAV5N4U2_9GAMM|nr:hypothetical protein SOASR030_32450 [Leminorella grimontii]